MKKIALAILLIYGLMACKKEEIIKEDSQKNYSCFIQSIVNDTVISTTYFDRTMTYQEYLKYIDEYTKTIQHDGYIEDQYCSCNNKIE